METRAGEDIGRGEDLRPPLLPLAVSLHDSFLHSHCSACSFPLPSAHFTPTSPSNSPPHHRYCSPGCSSLDSPPSMCSPPPLEDSSHLRFSLRLLHKLFHFQNDAVEVKLDRIGGLMTNYEKFLNLSENEEDDEALEMIKEGARAMKLLAGKLEGVVGVEEAVICSPQACFRFVTTKTIPPQQVVEGESQLLRLRIYPAAMDGGTGDGLDGDCKSSKGCGPSIIVRSIKGVKKNERIPITYTDLFQPKEMRQAELFTNYWFNCCCKRCTATPATYIDRALQEIFVSGVDGLNLISNEDSYRSKATAKFTDSIDGAIDEYLNFNNPESCCEKLEDLLTHGHPQEPLKPKPEKSPQCIRLHLFHHQSLHAYTTTLASAYRVRASDLLAFNPENHQHQMEAFTLSRISAAYSLLLAIVTHHLFLSESSIIACAVNFWKNAGESLVYLFRSSAWGTFSNLQQSRKYGASLVMKVDICKKLKSSLILDGFSQWKLPLISELVLLAGIAGVFPDFKKRSIPT
nr:protein SET DOMAIN GROUP 41-like [Coffea arabica]